MLKLNSENNKIVGGYIDGENKKVILNGKTLPLLTDNKFFPFLLTKTHKFMISTEDLVKSVENYRILSKVAMLRFTIVLGLTLVVLFLLVLLFGAESLSPYKNKIISVIVSLTLFAIITLWVEFFRNKTHAVRLPAVGKFDLKTLELIKTEGESKDLANFTSKINIDSYHLIKPIYYLSDGCFQLLIKSATRTEFRTLTFFTELIKTQEVQEIIKRLDIELFPESFGSIGINETSLGTMPVATLRSLLIYATEEALLTESIEVRPVHFFLAFTRAFPLLEQFITKNGSSPDLVREAVWYMMEKARKVRVTKFFDINEKYYQNGGFGRSMIYGYTYYLGKFSTDLNEKMIYEKDIFGLGHEREIEELASIVGKITKGNALLIGEPGVGKSSLIKGLAQRINLGNVPAQLHNKRIIQLDINALIAMGAGQNIEGLIQKAMSELAKAGNTILYIDEIQEIIATKSEGSGNTIAGIMLPYILEGRFPIVGTINHADYKKYFYANESLRTSFENVEVSELNPLDTLRILETRVPLMEQNYRLFITLPAMTTAIELSMRYVANRKLPDSAVGVVEAAASGAQAQGHKKLTAEHVAHSISLQSNVPVEAVNEDEAGKLLELEDKIKKRVIGQDEAVKAVVESMKRARTDIRDPNQPIGVFLFLGPTGTGKTHLSKVLSEEYFGSDEIIRLDMSEFQEVSSINKLLGVSGGDVNAQASVTLLDQVKTKPFSVVLFDEIEKAHPQVLDLFLQLFDEGRLTSNTGETVNFTNTIIICTSNIGSLNLLRTLEAGQATWEEAKAAALVELKNTLRPELINRYDKVIVFTPHSIEALTKITTLLLGQLAKRLEDKNIKLEWTEETARKIAEISQEPGMGARPIQRYIQEHIETYVADEMLRSGVSAGGTIKIDPANL